MSEKTTGRPDFVADYDRTPKIWSGNASKSCAWHGDFPRSREWKRNYYLVIRICIGLRRWITHPSFPTPPSETPRDKSVNNIWKRLHSSDLRKPEGSGLRIPSGSKNSKREREKAKMPLSSTSRRRVRERMNSPRGKER